MRLNYLKRVNLGNLWYRIYTKRVFIYVGLALMAIGAYIVFLLFGDNSLDTLLNIINERDVLENQVNDLQAKNAWLQQRLFELKGLEPK